MMYVLKDMKKDFFKYIYGATAFLVSLFMLSCSKHDFADPNKPGISRKVFLLYSAGFNSLSSYLKSDISDLKSGWIPSGCRKGEVLLVYSHHIGGKGYKTPTSPVLVRLYMGPGDKVVSDTLVVYKEGTVSSSPEQLSHVLNYVKDEFPSKSYGMVFSSHGTGYLPAGYYADPYKYENSALRSAALYDMLVPTGRPVPYVEPEYDPSLPMTKTIGQQVGYDGNTKLSYEIDIVDFAEAIPMYLEYILFDACLMGGVEVAYQLKDVCRFIGFSQAEVLAEGFDYTTLTEHLLASSEPDPEKVCEDYFNQYMVQTGVNQSATISLVDCTALQPLAEVCSRIFSEYADEISSLNPKSVQRYYRDAYHWFYDLESIMLQAGVEGELLGEFKEALNECVVYSAATPNFMGSFDIDIACGLSMFLPSDGGAYLKRYYTGLAWNQATGLVR